MVVVEEEAVQAQLLERREVTAEERLEIMLAVKAAMVPHTWAVAVVALVEPPQLVLTL
jgi:hypothetical protein